MGRAIPCLIRIVAACPRLRLIRVCASYNKTFPEHEAFISSNPVDETHVPRTGLGTPQANGRSGCLEPRRAADGPSCQAERSVSSRDGRRWRPSFRSYLPRALRAPPSPPGQRTAVPGYANAPLAPGWSVRPSGPTVRSSQTRRRHQRASRGPGGRSRPCGPRCSGSQSPALGVTRHCAAHTEAAPRGRPPGRVKGGPLGGDSLAPRQRR
jgi:hypothetical protein